MNTEKLINSLEQRLLKAESPGGFTAWFEFKEFSYIRTCDITSDDIPELITAASNWSNDEWFDRLAAANLDDESYDKSAHLPIHAWRALAELKADDCAGPLLSILNKLAQGEDDWSLDEFPHVFGALSPEVIPLLIQFADQTSHKIDARIVAVEGLAEIANGAGKEVARDQVLEKFNAWLLNAIEAPFQFESNRDAYDADPIRFNSAVLDGLLDLQATESAELIERAFAANQLDTGVAGDWSKVKNILNADGLGLEMPDEPVNSMTVFRARMGFGIFSNKRLMVDGEPDEEALQEYYENAIEQFAASDEGKEVVERFGSVGWVVTFLEYAASYLGETVDTMTSREADEVVFDIIPRKVSTEAESAEEIIFELRKFWKFVDRVHNLPAAKEIGKLFENKAVRKLHSELSNPANFGMAKSMFMSGKRVGFDMTTQEGMDGFMMFHNTNLMQQRAAGTRLDLAEPPMQRVSSHVQPSTPAMPAAEKKAFDKQRKKQLAAKLQQKKKRK